MTRYVTPLREGGSLPGLMEADDLGTYVVKFRGAGQGRKALIAEVITGLLARACGLRVPDLVTVELDPALAPGEPDQEIQDLLRASGGLNLGVDFLPGALDFDVKSARVDPKTAGQILWLDALTVNADRSWRNPNMLLWHGQLYLIDHGATLTFQHRWSSASAAAQRPYDAAGHALIGCDGQVEAADAELAPLVTADLLGEIVAQVPARSGWRGDRVRDRGGRAPGILRLAARPAGGPVGVAAGGSPRSPPTGARDDRRTHRSSTRCCASCPGWTAARRSTRVCSSTAGRCGSCGPWWTWTPTGCSRWTRPPTSRASGRRSAAIVAVCDEPDRPAGQRGARPRPGRRGSRTSAAGSGG